MNKNILFYVYLMYQTYLNYYTGGAACRNITKSGKTGPHPYNINL